MKQHSHGRRQTAAVMCFISAKAHILACTTTVHLCMRRAQQVQSLAGQGIEMRQRHKNAVN